VRAVLALAAVGVWAVLLALDAWLGSRLLASEVVAGLISPQGATLGGIVQVGAFVLARLLAVLVLPGVVAGTVVWAIPRR
jgi:hypothetical protein